MKLNEIHSQVRPSTLELKPLVKYYTAQGRHDDLQAKLGQEWGKSRLTYKGKPFFGGNALGEAYEKAEAAARRVMRDDGFTIDFHVEMPSGFAVLHLHVDDAQENYLGYDADSDTLYIGFDAWLNETEFNEEWERVFRQVERESFDEDDPEHSAAYNNAWKKFTKEGMTGILFHIVARGNVWRAEEIMTQPGGFYRSIYRSELFKSIGLTDLRLD